MLVKSGELAPTLSEAPTSRTSCNPESEGIPWQELPHQFGKDQTSQSLKGTWIAEKAGHMDQDLLTQGGHFSRMVIQIGGIREKLIDLHHRHPTSDPPLQGRRTIGEKIHIGRVAEQQENPGERLLLGRRESLRFQRGGSGKGLMPVIRAQCSGNFFWRQNLINASSSNSMLGHLRVLRR